VNLCASRGGMNWDPSHSTFYFKCKNKKLKEFYGGIKVEQDILIILKGPLRQM
jgi:hypothetical protein